MFFAYSLILSKSIFCKLIFKYTVLKCLLVNPEHLDSFIFYKLNQKKGDQSMQIKRKLDFPSELMTVSCIARQL